MSMSSWRREFVAVIGLLGMDTLQSRQKSLKSMTPESIQRSSTISISSGEIQAADS
jgi:hypothetical protein